MRVALAVYVAGRCLDARRGAIRVADAKRVAAATHVTGATRVAPRRRVAGAVRAQKAGFDGVEVHACLPRGER